MSVTFVRSGIMMPGKFPDAHKYVESRVNWLRDTQNVDVTLMTLLGGPAGTIAMATEHESVAEIEEIRRKMIGGGLPKEIATGQVGLFVPGETRERIWLQIT